MQFCPSGAGTNKRDVVRVAPLSKANHTNGSHQPYSYNLANSFPASYSTNTFPHNAATTADTVATSNNPNYPSFQITSMNYTSFPNATGHPHADAPPDHQHSDIIHSDAFVSAGRIAVDPAANTAKTRHHRNGFLSGATASAFNPFHSRTKGQKNPTGAHDPRFNSLKSGPLSGCRRAGNDVFHSMRSSGGGGGSVIKCKRHHSFVAPPQTSGTSYTVPTSTELMDEGDDCNRSQQPLYENLTDSIQIHEASPLPMGCVADRGDIGLPLADADVLELELQQRHSLYRSDSGISNSSYECVTPVPAPRRNPRKCQSVPVYMNLPSRGRGAAGGVAAGGGVRSSKRCRGSAGKGPGGTKCGRDVNGPVYSYEVSS